MSAEADLNHCREAIKHGSRSFHAASKLLPRNVREPALALYAFCRLADDAVDLQDDKPAAVLRLRDRLDLAYAGRPLNRPADRAFARMISDHDMPRALPEALLEGFAWDAMDRRYDTLSDLRAYSARVASAVGAMMTVLMGVRDRNALARACDLGVAMQLTNIARDIGEDTREGRIYLPLDWMSELRLDPDELLRTPAQSPAVAEIARRLLAEADRLYLRSEAGIPALPLSCRPGIYAARHIYAGIGRHVRRNRYDSFATRARTSGREKLMLLGLSLMQTGTSSVMPGSAVLYGAPLDEVRFLVDAAAKGEHRERWAGRTARMLDVLAQLEHRNRATH